MSFSLFDLLEITFVFLRHQEPIYTLEYPDTYLLGTSYESIEKGTILSQDISLTTPKEIAKVSLFLNLVNSDRKDYIEEEDGIACWAALNFQNISDNEAFRLYDADMSKYDDTSMFCDQGYLTNNDNVHYTEEDEVFLLSPKITYNLYLGAGTYNFYAKCAGPATFYYNWSNDNNPGKFSITSSNLIWRWVSSIDIETASLYDLSLYLGSADAQMMIIDQFRLVSMDLDESIVGNSNTFDNTAGPFNTLVRIKNGSNILSHSWLSSVKMRASNWYNYEMNESNVSDMTLEYIIISGRSNFNGQWNYTFD